MWFSDLLKGFGLFAMPSIVAARSLDSSGLRVQDPSNGYDRLSVTTGRNPSRPSPLFPSPPGKAPAGFIALGDSYSAGIGTGVNGTEDPCRYGLHAHPALMNKDLIDSEGVNKTSFQFLSCTGSGTEDLLLGSDQSQIGRLNTSLNADFALLSVGGNDLGFFDIMNSCIFRFYSFYSGTCEEALKRSEQQLASDDFENHLRLVITEILDRVHWERRPWFTITVTGYARFFNAETEACDDSSFGIWWRGPKLKRELRRRMNDMVLSVNAKIRSSIDSVNVGFATPKVFFVDYDARFEGHRFCEEGVIEPDYQRNDTWFFLVGGLDNAETLEEEDEIAAYGALRTPISQDSPLIDPDTCLEVALASGDWGEMAVCYMAMAKRKDPTLRLASGDVVSEQDMWYVPTYYGQTFHPRTKGHEAIRDQVYRHWHVIFGPRR